MGAGASALLPAECTKDDARAFAGERWNVTMDQRFDEICRDGKIAKEVVIQHEHSFGLEIRDWRRISEHAHQLTEAAVKEAQPIVTTTVTAISGAEGEAAQPAPAPGAHQPPSESGLYVQPYPEA